METFIDSALIIHASAGGFALLSGLIAIFTKKGRKAHIRSGQIYFWSMFTVIITGLIVGWYRNNLFLQAIAIFSFYMAFTGKRVLRNKKEITPKAIDWFVNILGISVALSMVFFGIMVLLKVGFAGIAPMLLVFGLLLLAMTVGDLRKMITKKFVKNAWLFDHISRMSGSFIATSTAFLLVNVSFDPAWVMWLLPTAIGTPLIFKVTSKWKKKLEPKKVSRK
jgi:hypothetical protein